MNLDELGERIMEELPNHQWAALFDATTVVWQRGELPIEAEALTALHVLVEPPACHDSSPELGSDAVLISEEEVQVYVQCPNSKFFAVGARRPINLGLMRSIVRNVVRSMSP